MNTKDRFMEVFLTIKDAILNALTLGLWGRWQGSKLVYPYRSNE